MFLSSRNLQKVLNIIHKGEKTVPLCKEYAQGEDGINMPYCLFFSHPDFTVGRGISPRRHPNGCLRTIPPVWNFTTP